MMKKLAQSFEILVKTNLVNKTEIDRGKQNITEIQKELDKLNLIIKEAQLQKKAPIPTTKNLNKIESCLEKILQNLEDFHQIIVLSSSRYTDQQEHPNHTVN